MNLQQILDTLGSKMGQASQSVFPSSAPTGDAAAFQGFLDFLKQMGHPLTPEEENTFRAEWIKTRGQQKGAWTGADQRGQEMIKKGMGIP